MRIHHLDCGPLRPLGGKAMDGRSSGATARLVCHCLLLELRDRLVLVDTGFGREDVAHPYPRLSLFLAGTLRVQRDESHTAIAQVRALGFAPEDVRDIVMTHLDFDHIGGAEDFPNATVHVHRVELDAARRHDGFIGQRRYRPVQFDDVGRWQSYSEDGETWRGFVRVRGPAGLEPDVLMIPLVGHTHGHCGIAVRDGSGWLFHAGDAYFHADEMAHTPRCPPGLRLYQRMMEVDRRLRLDNQHRLRELVARERGHVRVFCAHDAAEFDALRAEASAAEAVRTITV